MAKRVRKITPAFLKNIIMSEARKLQKETLETGINDPEKKLARQIKKIREAKKMLVRRVTKKV